MIITKTPFRISFVGGGSDLSAFYERHPGAVLSTSINHYMYISSHKYFEPNQIRTKYSQTETVESVTDLQHPILRTVLQDFGIAGGLEVSSIADLPAGTGMGSSSSFTVGLLHNLSIWKGLHPTKEELANGACRIEIERLGEPIGKQDQYAAAYGGLNVIRFLPGGEVKVEQVAMQANKLEELQNNLALYYIGNQRSASAILQEQKSNTSQDAKFESLKTMVALVDQLKAELEAGNLAAMGSMLHQNWLLKQQLASGITSPHITDLYQKGLDAGATGGKLLGAGGGGFMLFYCPKERQNALDLALAGARRFPFKFEQAGSQLIYHGND